MAMGGACLEKDECLGDFLLEDLKKAQDIIWAVGYLLNLTGLCHLGSPAQLKIDHCRTECPSAYL